MTLYTVTLRYSNPAYDEMRGIDYYVTAARKADAVAEAKRRARSDGHYGHGAAIGKGRATFTAIEDQA